MESIDDYSLLHIYDFLDFSGKVHLILTCRRMYSLFLEQHPHLWLNRDESVAHFLTNIYYRKHLVYEKIELPKFEEKIMDHIELYKILLDTNSFYRQHFTYFVNFVLNVNGFRNLRSNSIMFLYPVDIIKAQLYVGEKTIHWKQTPISPYRTNFLNKRHMRDVKYHLKHHQKHCSSCGCNLKYFQCKRYRKLFLVRPLRRSPYYISV